MTGLLGGKSYARERGPQVALYVVSQRLHRRDVEHSAAFPLGWRWLFGKPVDGPQEGRKRLSRTGRGVDERVIARRDGLPSTFLGAGRLRKERFEPGPRRIGKKAENCHLRAEYLDGVTSCRPSRVLHDIGEPQVEVEGWTSNPASGCPGRYPRC